MGWPLYPTVTLVRQVVSVGASRALVGLDFGQDELRLSVSDDWVGLPDDYEEHGHGFANNGTASPICLRTPSVWADGLSSSPGGRSGARA